MNELVKYIKAWLKVILFVFIYLAFAVVTVLLMIVRINSEVKITDILEKMSIVDLVMSWPGLFMIGLSIYVIATIVLGVNTSNK